MDSQHWPVIETVARDLAPRRADAELAQLSAYLNAHRDAADFFALLDDLAGPAGAALSPPGGSHAFAAVRDACQPLRALPPDALPAAVAFAARLLRYQVGKLPPAPRPQPAAPRPPLAVPARPSAGAPLARPQPGRPAAPPPGRQPAAAGPPGPRPPGGVPVPAEHGGPPPPGPRPAPPGRPAPADRPPVQPAAEQPRPVPPRRPPTMDDMLRALQAQFGGSAGGDPAEERPRERTESKRDRLRREQEEIRERYRRQQEEDEQARRG